MKAIDTLKNHIRDLEKMVLVFDEYAMHKTKDETKKAIQELIEAIAELEALETKEEVLSLVKEKHIKKQSFQPYVDETVEPCESYLVFCENHSPWDEEEKNMVRVHSNAESHKMLEILEKHFGIKNLHKKEHNEPK